MLIFPLVLAGVYRQLNNLCLVFVLTRFIESENNTILRRVITFTFGLNFFFYFNCITDIITKQYNNSEIHVQTLYKWDSEGRQMTYLNLYPKHVERHSVRLLLAIVVMFK